MKKSSLIESLLNKALLLEDVEKNYRDSLEGVDINPHNLEEVDYIQYAIGIREFEENLSFEIQSELDNINYLGKDEDVLYNIEKIKSLI